MTAEGHKVVALHGAFEGVERDRVIDAFRTAQAKVLITTNVLARGIDVQSVSMVVNYVRFIPVPPHHHHHHPPNQKNHHSLSLAAKIQNPKKKQDIPELANGDPDPQTYLHRIGRTGRFGRVGVSISFVHDKRSWRQLEEIARYFSVPVTRVDTSDWDEVEASVKKVIKSSRAGVNLQLE